ncbi:plasmid replication initiation protein, partial [Salmonella enterica subsp. enterica serovar Gallinarum]
VDMLARTGKSVKCFIWQEKKGSTGA